MKVQTIEKECVAKTGISIEFSNSEIDSIVRLLLVLDDKIEKGCKTSRSLQTAAGKQYKNTEEIPVSVDLKTLVRISWLLDKITYGRTRKPSDLFNDADASYLVTVQSINSQEGE